MSLENPLLQAQLTAWRLSPSMEEVVSEMTTSLPGLWHVQSQPWCCQLLGWGGPELLGFQGAGLQAGLTCKHPQQVEPGRAARATARGTVASFPPHASAQGSQRVNGDTGGPPSLPRALPWLTTPFSLLFPEPAVPLVPAESPRERRTPRPET